MITLDPTATTLDPIAEAESRTRGFRQEPLSADLFITLPQKDPVWYVHAYTVV